MIANNQNSAPENGEKVHCIIQVKGEKDRRAGPKVSQLVKEGWETKCDIERKTARLKEINAEILEKQGTGKALLIEGVTRPELKTTNRLSIGDDKALQKVLGPRFDDFVDTTITYKINDVDKVKTLLGDSFDELFVQSVEYKMTPDLKKLYQNNEQPQGMTKPNFTKVKKAITCNTTESVTWKPHSPKTK